jgi:hypothetical protein
MELFQENVIVTANNFNVMLVNPIWLDEHGIVRRDEILPDQYAFTPPLVQIATNDFGFLLMENRLQFVLTCEEERKQALIVERVGGFVGLLPHTPYSGLGLNFTWHYQPQQANAISHIGRQLFFKPDTPLAHEFDSDDAKFGAYYSKNVLGFRLKLSALPVDAARIDIPDQPAVELLQFAFNYHFASQSAADIQRALENWSAAKEHSSALINEIEATL